MFPFHGHFASTSTKYGGGGGGGIKAGSLVLWDSNCWLEKKIKMGRKLVEVYNETEECFLKMI